MKNTIKFTTPAIFGLATVLADFNSLECAIDNQSQTIWTNDINGFAAAFDGGGIDPEEFIVAAGAKADYNTLAKRLEAEAAALAAAEAAANAEAEDEASE